MIKKLFLLTATLCLLAALPLPAQAGCGGGGGGGGGEGRGSGAESEASTAPTGYTPGATGEASGSNWDNTVISWDHDQVSAEAEAQRQRDLEAEADRQSVIDQFDQRAQDQQAQDADYSSRSDRATQADIDAQRAQHIRQQLGNPGPATMAAIQHDFPTLDAQEAMIGIVTQMANLDAQRHNLPPETYNAIRDELTGYYQDLQDAAAVDRFNAAMDFGLSVAVNAGSAAVGGAPGFAIGFTYNVVTGGASNAATGTVVGLGSNAVQSVVPGYAVVAPVADAYAQNSLNDAIK